MDFQEEKLSMLSSLVVVVARGSVKVLLFLEELFSFQLPPLGHILCSWFLPGWVVGKTSEETDVVKRSGLFVQPD